MIKMTDEELVKKCSELHDIALWMKLPEYYRFPDAKFVKAFLKDVDLDAYYFRDYETKHYFSHMFEDSYTPIVENGGQVALLETTYFKLISRDKVMGLNMARPDKPGSVGAMDMVQTTEDGLYWFRLFESLDENLKTNFHCELSYYPSEDMSISGRGFKLVSGEEKWNAWMIRKYIPIKNGDLVEEDIVMLANKIYRNGLPYLHEMAKNGEILEITDEDRLQYAEVEHVDEPVNEMDFVIEKLSALEDVGFELSPEQKNLVDIYEKLHSEKFQQFKADREERDARQQMVREQILAENERKEEWLNSIDNPSNKRIEELKYMRRQIQGLESLREIAPELLSDYQNNLVDKGNVFFEMFERSKEEKHEVDTGMSPEIRDWYQEHYTSEESTPGKRI